MLTELSNTVSIASAARQAAVHPNSVRDWLRRGLVEGVRTPIGTVIVTHSLAAYLQRREQNAAREVVAR